MTKKRMSAWLVVVGCLLGVSGCTPGDKEGPIKVRMATLFGKDHHLAKKLEWISQELEKRSGDRFQCEVFPGSMMGGEKENLEDLLLGNLELMNGAGSYLYRYCPEAAVLEMPSYGWKDRVEAWKVIRAYWPKFVDVLERKGFHPVGLDIRDYWGVLYKDPITSLDSIKKAKFRSVNADLWIQLTELYGAVPNPIPYADAYMAFKTGVSVGTLTSVTGGAAAKWHEVLKCFLDTRLVYSESFMLSSKKWLDNLPPDLKEIFLAVCEESEIFNLDSVEEQYNRNKKEMIESGLLWVDRDQLDMTDIEAKARKFRDGYMKSLGEPAYAFFQEWIAHVEGMTGRALP
jgi:C4-dicarboxylate-binding protein DctP